MPTHGGELVGGGGGGAASEARVTLLLWGHSFNLLSAEGGMLK